MQLPSRDQMLGGGVEKTADGSQLGRFSRAIASMCGCGLLGLLIVARTLEPDPSGMGTHRQLDLPGCGFFMVFGKPCPSCGMTTAWAHVTRGEIIASMKSNFGGFLLAIGSLFTGGWLLMSAARGRWIIQPHIPTMILMMILVVLATLIHWLWKITI